ncbi:MAG: phosphoglycerate kinase [Candidatus Pacebacteria bacterium]|nr:phosphoglycerate kinase [Candidatus Paceibacterota bacterium]
MPLKPFNSADFSQKKVLMRVDFNVPLRQNEILDDFRIQRTLPTINLLKEKKAEKIILISHFGRPLERDPKFSLEPIARYLNKVIGETVYFLKTPIDRQLSEEIEKLPHHSIILLENIRFYEGEEKNDRNFAKELAKMGDCFINEAFSVSHRRAASLCAIKEFLPSFMGKLLEEEISQLDGIIKSPRKPLVVILGGAKVKDKLPVIKRFLKQADYILLGGVVASTVLKANDFSIGSSAFDNEAIEEAKNLSSQKAELILPGDFRVLNRDNKKQVKELGLIVNKDAIFDIGPTAAKTFAQIISKAKTIFFNGPMGKFEDPKFSDGTKEIIEAILKNQESQTIIGGGDTLLSFKILKPEYKIQNTEYRFFSTGGGAMLEYLAGKSLPALKM